LDPISSIKVEHNIVKVTVAGLPDRPGMAARLFSSLAREGINVGLISEGSVHDGYIDISFTVAHTNLEQTINLCRVAAIKLGADDVNINQQVARVTVAGPGVDQQPGIAAAVFEVFADEQVNIEMIATTENAISCIVREDQAELVAQKLRERFGVA